MVAGYQCKLGYSVAYLSIKIIRNACKIIWVIIKATSS